MSKSDNLVKGSVLAKNSLLNLSSKIVPMLIGIISLPFIIQNVGEEKFGIVSICWLIIGYFSVLDMGLSRSTVNQLANDIKETGGESQLEISRIIIVTLFAIGVFFSLMLALFSNTLTISVFNISEKLQNDTIIAFYFISVGLPFTLVSNGLRGILETYQRFKEIASIDVFSGISMYLGLAVLTFFSQSLVIMIVYLLSIRFCVFLMFCISQDFKLKELFNLNRSDFSYLGKALSYGKWIGISNVIGPFMGQMDRYLIGALITMSAVTYYSAPLEMVLRVNIIPISFAMVLFPAFSILERRTDKAKSIFSQSLMINMVVSLPIVIILTLYAREVLTIWLGEEFAEKSTIVFQILIVSSFFSSNSQIPFSFIQGIGLPDKTAKLHMLQAIIYLPLLAVLIISYGIVGAAFSRLLRVLFDMSGLYIIIKKETGYQLHIFKILLSIMFIGIALFISFNETDRYLKAIYGSLVLVIYFAIAWKSWLPEELKLYLLKQKKAIF